MRQRGRNFYLLFVLRKEEAEVAVVFLDVEQDFEDAEAVFSPGVGHGCETALVQHWVKRGRTQNFLDFAELGIEEWLVLRHLV